MPLLGKPASRSLLDSRGRRREAAGNQTADPVQPFIALLLGARHNHAEHFAVDVVHSAKTEHTVPPDQLQGIAEGSLLTFGGRVGGVEHDRGLRPEQAHGDSLATVTREETVRDTGTNDPVYPTLEDRGRLSSPVGMHDHDALRCRYLLTVHRNRQRESRPGWDLDGRKNGVEPFFIKVMEADDVAGPAQFSDRRFRDGMVKATRVRVGKDDRDSHVPPWGLSNDRNNLPPERAERRKLNRATV